MAEVINATCSICGNNVSECVNFASCEISAKIFSSDMTATLAT